MSFLFHDFAAARDALQSGAPFARVDLGLSSRTKDHLNTAMAAIYPMKPSVSLSNKPYKPETLEGKALMLSYELLGKASLLGFVEQAVFELIRRVIFESSEIFALHGDMLIRSGADQNSAIHFHTDRPPEDSEESQYFMLVTAGDAPGTELVAPGSDETLCQLACIAEAREKAMPEVLEQLSNGTWEGDFFSHPFVEHLGVQFDNVVPEADIIRASAYEVCILRHSDYARFGSPGATWHRAPAHDASLPRFLMTIDAGVLC